MTVWPGSLPQKFLRNGFTEEEPDYVIQTQMDAPVPKTRRRFTAAVRPYSGKMRMTFEQKEIFQAFYLANCASEFSFPDPYTGWPITAIFMGKPQYESDGGRTVTVSLKIGHKP